MTLLGSTAPPDEINPADYDAIYFTGGHAVMWDFPDDEPLQRIIRVDDRKDYGDVREIAIGCIGGRLHVLCFTRRASAPRIISLRKANEDEVNDYRARAQKT